MNLTNVESFFSAAYLEDYLDCVENLPDDLQRNISHMRELDVTNQEILRDLETYQQSLTDDLDSANRKKTLLQIQRFLIISQEIADEKLQVVQQILDLIENKSRQLDVDFRNIGIRNTCTKDQENTEPPKPDIQPERSSKRARRQRNECMAGIRDDVPHNNYDRQDEKPFTPAASSSSTSAKKSKKKKRKSKSDKEQQHQQLQRNDSPIEQPIDPDEPTYCLCQQISYGEMIGCDNDRCPIEWFHFSCVALTTKPKGKWYCPKCRGDRPNVMRSRT